MAEVGGGTGRSVTVRVPATSANLGPGFDAMGIALELTDAAKEYLANRGYDAVYGARPLKRTIQKEIIDPLAVRILNGDFVPGDKVIADVQSGEILFRKRQAKTEERKPAAARS